MGASEVTLGNWLYRDILELVAPSWLSGTLHMTVMIDMIWELEDGIGRTRG